MKTNYLKKMNDVMWPWGIPTILGVSLILSGIGIAFMLDLEVLTAVISGFMFLSGSLGVIYFLINKKQLDGWSFYLILAILDFVLATLLIIKISGIQITTISIILSFWILSQGLGKIIYSMDIQKLGVRNWDSDLVTGILFVVYGIISISLLPLSPAFILLTTAIVLSFSGIFQLSVSLKRQAEYKSYTREVTITPAKVSLREARSK